jgi:hypothetical protein
LICIWISILRLKSPVKMPGSEVHGRLEVEQVSLEVISQIWLSNLCKNPSLEFLIGSFIPGNSWGASIWRIYSLIERQSHFSFENRNSRRQTLPESGPPASRHRYISVADLLCRCRYIQALLLNSLIKISRPLYILAAASSSVQRYSFF